jgi:hypothetical protein
MHIFYELLACWLLQKFIILRWSIFITWWWCLTEITTLQELRIVLWINISWYIAYLLETLFIKIWNWTTIMNHPIQFFIYYHYLMLLLILANFIIIWGRPNFRGIISYSSFLWFLRLIVIFSITWRSLNFRFRLKIWGLVSFYMGFTYEI